MIVDLPHPLSPTNVTFLPASISRLMPFNIYTSGLDGYVNSTPFNTKFPFKLFNLSP